MAKSQKALKVALIDLLKRQSLAQISVKQLCSAAQIGRSTFYSHYSNLDELLEEIEDELVRELSQRDQPLTDRSRIAPNDFSYFSKLLDFVKEHQSEILVLTKFNPDARFIEKWKEAIKLNLSKRGLPKNGLIYEMITAEVIAAFDYFLLNPDQIDRTEIQKIISKTLKIFEN